MHAAMFHVVGLPSSSPLAISAMSGIWHRMRTAKKNIMGTPQFCRSASMPTAHTRSPTTIPSPTGMMKRRSFRSLCLMSARSAISLS